MQHRLILQSVRALTGDPAWKEGRNCACTCSSTRRCSCSTSEGGNVSRRWAICVRHASMCCPTRSLLMGPASRCVASFARIASTSQSQPSIRAISARGSLQAVRSATIPCRRAGVVQERVIAPEANLHVDGETHTSIDSKAIRAALRRPLMFASPLREHRLCCLERALPGIRRPLARSQRKPAHHCAGRPRAQEGVRPHLQSRLVQPEDFWLECASVGGWGKGSASRPAAIAAYGKMTHAHRHPGSASRLLAITWLHSPHYSHARERISTPRLPANATPPGDLLSCLRGRAEA